MLVKLFSKWQNKFLYLIWKKEEIVLKVNGNLKIRIISYKFRNKNLKNKIPVAEIKN